MAFYRMPSGHFAYVLNESGNRQLVTEEQFRNCCCPAPSTCPCSPWPPEEWPCNDLLETYSLSAFDLKRAPTSWYRLKSSITLSAYSPTPCAWQGSGIVDFSNDEGDNWSDAGPYTFDIGLSASGWRFRFYIVQATVDKSTGQTPIGAYTENVNVFLFPSATMSVTIS